MVFTNLVVLSSGTCGQQGELLGSDEKETILLVTVIIDTTTNTVSTEYLYFVVEFLKFCPFFLSNFQFCMA